MLKTTLENGLTVMLKEIHTAPLVSSWLWYRAGVRDETEGKSGLSHWVEHMLFKGTPEFPEGVLDKQVARLGGYWNAMTHLDWTTYYATLPAGKIDLILRAEADRMTNGLFREEAVASERTVILSERRGNENDPTYLLAEQVIEALFPSHPYRQAVTGKLDDLEAITRDDLYQHYRRYYQPGNAVLTLAGDFDSDALLVRIREIFEPIEDHSRPRIAPPVDPWRRSEERITVSGPGETSIIEIRYPAPAAKEDDFLAFMVLDSLLTGPSTLDLFGGGISNKTSRLYQALVEKRIAVTVSGGVAATIDPYFYQIVLSLPPGKKEKKALAVLDRELEKFISRPPAADELSLAVRQARALFAYGSDSITTQAAWLGYAEMFDSYAWFESYLERLEAVAPADVQRVAEKYLRPEHRVIGVYQANGKGGAE